MQRIVKNESKMLSVSRETKQQKDQVHKITQIKDKRSTTRKHFLKMESEGWKQKQKSMRIRKEKKQGSISTQMWNDLGNSMTQQEKLGKTDRGANEAQMSG